MQDETMEVTSLTGFITTSSEMQRTLSRSCQLTRTDNLEREHQWYQSPLIHRDGVAVIDQNKLEGFLRVTIAAGGSLGAVSQAGKALQEAVDSQKDLMISNKWFYRDPQGDVQG